MTAQAIISRHTYNVPSLLAAFSKVLEDKNAQVASRQIPADDWRAAWPDGNSRVETEVVTWLRDLDAKGVKQVVTDAPLTDNVIHGVCHSAHASLYLQIKAGQIKPVLA